jgi:hypothetical protein
MPIHNLLIPSPLTRVNDFFSRDASIDASPVLAPKKTPIVQSLPNSLKTRYQADFYQQIACDLVVETVFDYPYPYISEKTLRPIACKRMFIVLGPSGLLSLLHAKGFTTFNDIIDESYDNVLDPTERFKLVITEVRKFCDLSPKDIRQYLKKNQQKIDSNFYTLINLQQRELQDLTSQLNDIN